MSFPVSLTGPFSACRVTITLDDGRIFDAPMPTEFAEHVVQRLNQHDVLVGLVRQLLPHARAGVKQQQARMVGNLYPAILDTLINRAERAAEGMVV